MLLHKTSQVLKMNGDWTAKIVALLAIATVAFGNKLHPVILVPGDGGSQILARLNKTESVSYVCEKQSDWFYLWLDPTQMLPYLINCWTDNIKLIYDKDTHTTSNTPGVEMRFPDFGNTTSVEYIDVGRSSYALYFGKVVDSLVRHGYVRKESIFGAPYDFRKAPNEQHKFFSDVKALVEEAYQKNDNTPVIFITHSMGSPMIQYFLVHQSEEWKSKHVRAFLSLSGVFGGTVRATKVYAVGDNLGNYFVEASMLRYEQRTNPSLAWLMPHPELWDDNDVIVQSQNINITTKNYNLFYEMMDQPIGEMMRQDTLPLSRGIPPPGVEVYCWHGAHVPTIETLVYYKFPQSTPSFKYGDGDGTVNKRSMEACLRWQTNQSQPVHHRSFRDINHAGMIKDDKVVNDIKNLVLSINKREENALCGDSAASPCPQINVT